MDLKQFGEELRSLRKQAQWSQEELIDELDQLARAGSASEYRVIDGTLLSRWEHARIQNGRQWRPTRPYTLYLIQLFATYLDLKTAQEWAAHAGYQVTPAELQEWFTIPLITGQAPNALAQAAISQQDTPPAFPHNLPAPLTTFAGREAEMARVITYLASPTSRLVTLVGEGGVGKSRLAMEVAHAMVNDRIINDREGAFGDGIYFVSLVALTSLDSVVSAIAGEMGFMPAGADNLEEQLLSKLSKGRYLLVLDNFEHLVAAVSPLVIAILQAAPAVHLLVTSRIRLNVEGEWVVALSGLPFPALEATRDSRSQESTHFNTPDLADIDLAGNYAAVRLFVARARQRDAQFGGESDFVQMAAIARICGLLQGLPLGIEMAAAWVHMLSCVEIGNQIARNLDFLTAPHRNTPERHRSMRAVFEHSWRLLGAEEQEVLATLAVFKGSFDYEAAASVAEASLLTLRTLVDKSLLTYVAGRYELHELLRHFAEEQLKSVNEKYMRTLARHSAYYLHFVAAREGRLAGQEAHQAAAEISAEFNNIRQAWISAAEGERFEELEISYYALWRFYLLNGSSGEGDHLFHVAIDRINAAQASLLQKGIVRVLLSKLLTMCSIFLKRQGYIQRALLCATEAIRIAESWSEGQEEDFQLQSLRAFASWALSFVLLDMGESEEALRVAESALKLIEGHGHYAQISELTHDMQWQLRVTVGAALIEINDYALARKHVEEALVICQNAGKMRGLLTCLGNLGWIELQTGNYAAARQFYEQALPLSRTLGYRLEEAANLAELGDTVRLQGEYGRARQALESGVSLAYEINAYLHANLAVEALVYLYCYLGSFEEAQEWVAQWRQLDWGVEDRQLLAQAVIAYHTGDYRQACDLATQARQLLEKSRNRSAKAKTLVILGHTQAALQQWADAMATYGEALALYTALDKAIFAVEARAGLANVALKQRDDASALLQVEAILPVLAEASYVGIDEPFYTYWVCYCVLSALQDERATSILASAYQLLLMYAHNIDDDRLRLSFWENVAVHGELRAAYLESRSSQAAGQQ